MIVVVNLKLSGSRRRTRSATSRRNTRSPEFWSSIRELRGARILSTLVDAQYVHGLQEDVLHQLSPDASKPLIHETRFGAIIIGGVGDDAYDKLEARKVAVLIDLGGDDVYADRVATSSSEVHASVVIDVEGDDVYESSLDHSLGHGFLGIGILADMSGDDSYLGLTATQGSAVLGAGLLIDSSGDDVYRAQSNAQGCGFMGVGALIDTQGDDRYESHIFSQGAGIAGGIGALLDRRGRDHYFAKGSVRSSYDTPGKFQGWSQGVGVGIRFLVSGGVGILHDGGGADVMDGGDFSQGGGYYFGWGMLQSDGAEADKYIGSRYVQGFAAHQARRHVHRARWERLLRPSQRRIDGFGK